MDQEEEVNALDNTDFENEFSSDFDIDRWSSPVADGQLPFPTNLRLQLQSTLAARVSELRRARLISHIARTIAIDILRERH
jgi:hypothetical protein